MSFRGSASDVVTSWVHLACYGRNVEMKDDEHQYPGAFGAEVLLHRRLALDQWPHVLFGLDVPVRLFATIS